MFFFGVGGVFTLSRATPYLYRQRTYRAGGKVRTESQYVGACGGDGRAPGVTITSLDELVAQSIEIKDNTTTTQGIRRKI